MKITFSRDEGATLLRFEPSAMILAREGDFTALTGRLLALVAVVGVWIMGWSIGLEGEYLLAWIVASGVLVGGGMMFYLAMSAINYSVKPHPRLAVIGGDGHLAGFPGRDESVVAMSDISHFTVRKRRGTMRPWRRYAVVFLDQQFREYRLTPSVLRRADASDLAAALTSWSYHPQEFELAVAKGRAPEFLELLWSDCPPQMALQAALSELR